MALQIRRAQRRKAKLRLALLGPTGSGKTYSALKLAFGIGGKVGVIDTENGSADLYADIGEYDVITLAKPYTVAKYREAIDAFEQAGYDVIIIDSLTHAWAGAGGLLDRQGQVEKRVGNSFAAWREITPEHNALVEALLASPAHIIGTMRVKTEYVLEENSRGKMVPVKKGMQPVQRDGLEYEFSCVLDIDADHKASASKDRTRLFDGFYDRLDESVGRKLRDWLETGEDAAAAERAEKAAAMDAWLSKVQTEFAACESIEAVMARKNRPDIGQAMMRLDQERIDRLLASIAAALARFDSADNPSEAESLEEMA